jgi:putative endonuclease
MGNVYVLYSQKLDRFYTGSCLDLEKRLLEHKSKSIKDSFTAKANDWELFLLIGNLGYNQARCIELHIKKMHSVKYINDLKAYPELRSKLVERFK